MRTEDDLIAALATLESQAPDADQVMTAVRRRLANDHRSRHANLVDTRANSCASGEPRDGAHSGRVLARPG
jgi:hypothetical protein